MYCIYIERLAGKFEVKPMDIEVESDRDLITIEVQSHRTRDRIHDHFPGFIAQGGCFWRTG